MIGSNDACYFYLSLVLFPFYCVVHFRLNVFLIFDFCTLSAVVLFHLTDLAEFLAGSGRFRPVPVLYLDQQKPSYSVQHLYQLVSVCWGGFSVLCLCVHV